MIKYSRSVIGVTERSVEEILEILRKYNIGLMDICRVIVHHYDLKTFDDTAVGRLRDAAKEILGERDE